MDSCLDREDLREAAKVLEGSRDVGAQLYCALLRSAGVRARLVCSLQPLACASGAPMLPKPRKVRAPSKLSKEEQACASMENWEAQSKAASAAVAAAAGPSTSRSRLGHPNAKAYNFQPPTASPAKKPEFKTPKHIKESPHPVYWVEILDVGHQKWQPVDAVVTHTFWKPNKLEPPITDKENSLSYVVAFEADGTARDVTRRYAKAYTAKTKRLRLETAIEGGDRWWCKVMKSYRRLVASDLDQIEDNELAGAEAKEPMPRNIQDFKNHPIYALERHLRQHEVLAPGANPSGTVGAGSKGPLERIYRRKDVRVARSADKWYRQFGREIKPNEIPVKWLPKKTQPKGSNFEVDEDDSQSNAGMPIYTLDQTALYEPPLVQNGRVPKNKFGNIDAYVPSMVPRGAVHIRHEHASRAAFILGVDYAPALTGFAFKGRHGTAVLSGIVAAQEYEDAIKSVIKGLGNLEQEMEDARRRLKALKQWRRFLMGLRIRERVWSSATEGERREAERDAELDAELEEAPSDVTEEFDMASEDDAEYGGGGFIIG